MRAVTADHVLFKEVVYAFLKQDNNLKRDKDKRYYGYLLLNFNLKIEIDFKDFKILPSHEIILTGPNKAFISPVLMPNWIDKHNGHLFTIALSSLISFCTEKPIKSTRDDYWISEQTLNQKQLSEIAIQYPILVAGPGANNSISQSTQKKWAKRLTETYNLLKTIDESDYKGFMQSMRLFQLAFFNKRDDFDLAFSLLVASIESIAQKAVKIDDVINKDEKLQLNKQKDKIKKLCEKNKCMQWFSQASQAILNQKKLQKRFVEFIFRYAPYKKWYELDHPEKETIEHVSEISGQSKDNWKWVTQKSHWETYPEDYTKEQLRLFILNTYKYRSKFFHEGKPTDHKSPTEYKRFFEEQIIFDEKTRQIKKIILIKFELLAVIARIAIINFFKEKIYEKEQL